jgi:hypothetical protein
MDWMNRGVRPNHTMNQQAANTAGPGGGGKKRLKNQKWFRVVATTLLFSGTLLVVAVVLYTAFGGRNNNESKYVDTTKTQAVFLNGGQVYFGQIQALNGKYLRMTDVFYLRVNQQVQPNGQQQNSNPELVKLGCELHRPKDEMVINREQVTFWENLKEDSAETTVPGAIKKYKADNPNGQKCNTTTTQSSETPKKQ